MDPLQRIPVRIDERGGRPPAPAPEDPFNLRGRLDNVTEPLRKTVRRTLDQTIDILDRAPKVRAPEPGLSERYHEAASQLTDLRQRVIAGGVDGLVASGLAAVQCALIRIRPA